MFGKRGAVSDAGGGLQKTAEPQTIERAVQSQPVAQKPIIEAAQPVGAAPQANEMPPVQPEKKGSSAGVLKIIMM